MTSAKKIEDLRVKLFVDGSGEADMLALNKLPYIKGFTTNPSLMREAGVSDYVAFAQKMVAAIPDKSISFEVFSDDFTDIERQARIITTWGPNVYVKIPSMNTKGESTAPIVKKLSAEGIKLNITMIIRPEEVATAVEALSDKTPSIVSVFAGRAADAGFDPMPIMKESKGFTSKKPVIELLWASTRELYSIYEAEEIGCEIITVPPSILKKIPGIGKDLKELTLKGVNTFFEDGKAAGFAL